MSKIIGTVWKNASQNTIGIVAVQADHDDTWKSYMGVVPGHNESDDKEHVRDNGAKLSKLEAIAFFPRLDPEKFNES